MLITSFEGIEYLSLPELQGYIRRTPGAIRNLVLRKAIPFRKPGGRLLFIREEIDEWVKRSAGVSFQQISEEAVRNGNGDAPGHPRSSGKKATRRANGQNRRVE